MTTAAATSQGVQLKRGTSGAAPYNLIGEIYSFDGPEETVGEIDVTSFDSTFREVIAAIPDAGTVSFEMNFVASNAQQVGLRTDLRAGTVQSFQLELNDMPSGGTINTVITFNAIVKSLSITGSVDSQVTASCELKISGQPTWVYAA